MSREAYAGWDPDPLDVTTPAAAPEPAPRRRYRGWRAAAFRLVAWLQRHRSVQRLVVRGRVRTWVSRLVWAAVDTPEFRDSMARSKADYAAGRWYSFDAATGETTPNPDWPTDGPQPRDAA